MTCATARRRARAATAFIALLLPACTRLDPPTPPLLEGVTARGGWWFGGCPPANAFEESVAEGSEEALSPDLTERLARDFPAGSEAARLERELRDQGFQVRAPCAADPAIRLGEFRQSGGGLFNFPVFGQVAWKQDDRGRLVWTKGHVAFTGP